MHPHGRIRPSNGIEFQHSYSWLGEIPISGMQATKEHTQRGMLKRKSNDVSDPLNRRRTMWSSKALGNHDNNSTMTIDSLLGVLVKWREAKRFLVSILIDTWGLSVSRSVSINTLPKKVHTGTQVYKEKEPPSQHTIPYHFASKHRRNPLTDNMRP